jgi:hypothetical protein
MNTSNAGILRKIAEVVGTVLDIVRLEILRSEETISAAAKIARVTSEAWYVEKAYAYQQGDQVVVVNEATQELGYATIDATKQIIKQASIGATEEGLYYINVATSDANNNVVSLTQDQLNAFGAYYRNFWGVGAQIQAASNPPAVLSASKLYIRFDKAYNLDTIKNSIYTGLHDLQMQRRTTNILYINDIESYISGLNGIKYAYFSEIKVSQDSGITTPQDGKIVLNPGYFNFDPNLYDFTKNITIFEAI